MTTPKRKPGRPAGTTKKATTAKKPSTKKAPAKTTEKKPATNKAPKGVDPKLLKERESLLNKVKAEMEKKYGANVLRKASDLKESALQRVSTGNFALDVALGGGYPLGRFIMLSGEFSTSKSTLLYHAIREFQNTIDQNTGLPMGVLLLQGENGSFTDEYARLIGIDTNGLIINESASMEESQDLAISLMRQGLIQLVGIDSVAVLQPMKEYDKDMNDSMQMGIAPKLWGEFTRKFQASNNLLSRQGKTPCTIIAINQLREKIGSMSRDPSYEPGGKALGFTSSLTIRLRKGDWIKDGTGKDADIIGHATKFKINKSKVSQPFLTGEWDFYTEDGAHVEKGHFDNFKSLILEAVTFGVVDKSGAWLSYGELKVQGANALVEALRDNPELYAEIAEKTLAKAREKNAGAIDQLIAESEKEMLANGETA